MRAARLPATMSEADDKSAVPIENSPGFLDQKVRDFVFSESRAAFCKRQWFLSKDGRSLCSSDFSTEVELTIHGEFPTEAALHAYGYWLMRMINKGEQAYLAELGLQENNEVEDGKQNS